MHIYETHNWSLKHRADSKLPGYLILESKNLNVDSLSSLPHDALLELGLIQAEATRVLEKKLGAELVYICRFGHQPGNPPHFHIVPLYAWIKNAYDADPLFKDNDPDGPIYFTYITRAFIEYPSPPKIIGPSVIESIGIVSANFKLKLS